MRWPIGLVEIEEHHAWRTTALGVRVELRKVYGVAGSRERIFWAWKIASVDDRTRFVRPVPLVRPVLQGDEAASAR